LLIFESTRCLVGSTSTDHDLIDPTNTTLGHCQVHMAAPRTALSPHSQSAADTQRPQSAEMRSSLVGPAAETAAQLPANFLAKNRGACYVLEVQLPPVQLVAA
jgi:hypothetical protein